MQSPSSHQVATVQLTIPYHNLCSPIALLALIISRSCLETSFSRNGAYKLYYLVVSSPLARAWSISLWAFIWHSELKLIPHLSHVEIFSSSSFSVSDIRHILWIYTVAFMAFPLSLPSVLAVVFIVAIIIRYLIVKGRECPTQLFICTSTSASIL
jgi:hypothetical protein